MKLGKKLTFGIEARQKVIEGINAVADAVKVTLGPKGHTVIIERDNLPHITKDGVSVAKSIRLSDREKNLGARLAREASEKVVFECGDGTTSTNVMIQSLVNNGVKLVSGKVNSNNIRRGIEAAVNETVKYIKENAKKIETLEELEHVAKLSANGDDEISNLLKEAFSRVGLEGTVKLAFSKTSESSLEVTEGLRINKGWFNKIFVTDEVNAVCELDKPYVLLINETLSNYSSIASSVALCKTNHRPLVIVANDFKDNILSILQVNKSAGSLSLCIKNPMYGEAAETLLEDLAVMSGATIISESKGKTMDMITPEDLGSLENVYSSMDLSVFKGSKERLEFVEKYCNVLRQMMNNTEDEYKKSQCSGRIASLTTGIATIKIGGISEVEAKEKMDRADDALCAIKAAIEEGTVVGGGTMYLRASKNLAKFTTKNREMDLGVQLVRRSLKSVITQVLKNAGEESEEIISDILSNRNMNYGYNAYTEKFVDLRKDGVIEPAKVSRCVLQNAASMASLILTTDCIITSELELNEIPVES